ncbi:hypothetical protein D3C78_1867010 [compost metagenome]
MVRAGLEYLDYLRIDCSIDLNSYIDEEVLETLFFKMLSEHLERFGSRPAGDDLEAYPAHSRSSTRPLLPD